MSTVPPLPKTRNPRTQAKIERETWWQITVPLAVILLVLLTIMALVVAGTAAPVRTGALADVSLMGLILLAFVGSLVFLAVLLALAVGLALLLREAPFFFKRIQDFVWVVANQTRSMTQQVDHRVVGVHLSLAALKSIFTSFQDLLRALADTGRRS